MNLQPCRCSCRGRIADGIDEGFCSRDVGERHDLRFDEDLPGRVIAGNARVHHDLDGVDPFDPGLEGVYRGIVRRRQAPVANRNQSRGPEVDVQEGRSHVRRLNARHVGGQESARRVLGDAAQGGQRLDGQNRDGYPGDDDHEAEANARDADQGKDPVHEVPLAPRGVLGFRKGSHPGRFGPD